MKKSISLILTLWYLFSALTGTILDALKADILVTKYVY